ncbi:hypothetical protein MtrunA17_Chr2g0322201 [Medicago truncatula]|uniref:Transmembrane protein n=1 Tax=Medicago truncatula TaxID=3880 RepID=A0A396JGN1_MEDTR|nr:hypothetical protein MtrunA17_Chr2g0322201 [Medicago truncatula]
MGLCCCSKLKIRMKEGVWVYSVGCVFLARVTLVVWEPFTAVSVLYLEF